ncbi:MAG: prenyltransferase, partial [Gemmatimonadetes bacterium]|nr:prenyltransferase [Gemmatimonadota bacterium]
MNRTAGASSEPKAIDMSRVNAPAVSPTARPSRLSAWIALQELPKHLANLLPFALGTILAWWQAGAIDWRIVAVATVGLFFLTDGTYISNEYFDYDNDKANLDRIGGADAVGITTTGGTRVLVKGLIPRHHALVASVVCFIAAIPFGLWLQLGLHTGPLTIPLGALGIFIGWFYSAPPIRAAYRGLGELFIAAGQGLVIFAAYYVQLGFSWMPLVVSLPWFIALPALKMLREFPDFDADAATGKRGLTQRLGRERAATVYSILVGLALLSFVPGALWTRSWTYVITLLPIVLLGRSAVVMA